MPPYAKRNFVDHTVTDQSSILRFIEDNWLSGQRIGGGSFDTLAGPLTPMLDLDHHNNGKLILDPTTGGDCSKIGCFWPGTPG